MQLLPFISTCILWPAVSAYLENYYYCGEDNCYSLLDVTRDATKQEIKRAWRIVASKTHPDRFQDPEEKQLAELRFQRLSTAYDILKDDEGRKEYDYMLDHPDEFYQNFYRAWRRRVAPNIDVRIVIGITISLISLVQYYNKYTKYEEAIKYFCSVPKYRINALEIAKQEGLLDFDKKKSRQLTKEMIKEREENVIRKIVENKMDIRGVYAKPSIKDILWVQMVLLPYWTFQYTSWYIRWAVKFWIMRHEYETVEKLYLIRKFLGISQGQFDALDEGLQEEYLQLNLWQQENFDAWKSKRDEEIRQKQAESGKYKAYRRYMKSNGPSRMYFDD